MSRKPPNKRKRLESTRSQASGISALSNIARSTDDVNDSDSRCSATSNCNCNGFLHGTHNDAINVVPPQINFDTQTVSQENRRQRRVSWGLCDEDEETIPKGLNNQPDVLFNNRSNGQDQRVEIYAKNYIPHQDSAVPITSRRSEVELRRQLAEQQQQISHLLERDRINTQKLLQRQKLQQRRSISVTSLRGSPQDCVTSVNRDRIPGQHVYESVPRVSQINIPSEANVRNESVFVFPSARAAGVAQRRSRSCDFLLNDEEGESFISPANRSPLQIGSSSGYEHVTEHSSDASSDGNGNGEDQNKSNYTNVRKYDFRRWFYVLLAFNIIIILMNVTGIPFLYVTLKSPEHHEETVCIKCESLNMLYIDKSVFMKKDDQCCLKSSRQLFELFANVTRQLKSAPLAPQAMRSSDTLKRSHNEDIPMVQYKAMKLETIDNVTRISWDKEVQYPIQRVFGKLDQASRNTTITIPVAGLYYIYSRVHYIKPYGIGPTVIFGHSVLKIHEEQKNIVEDTLDSVNETCFQRNDVVMHTSHLHFVHNFKQNDKVYVRLDNDQHFDRSLDSNTKFGLFMIQRL
ncbi:uncharacterized protein LOC123554183 [Mercenaria mercenaria]|uniref:uncharacterized protein LOC123554183 n=1 Tax=Mercenaria mercenaria TaxID=6596 RepID=UPI00234F7DAC|nr:uncharacterized protein LOC123554183 [Mercenaria mercenaria]XP_053404329.1 uncharacterized protein LOC123554183 [Mercenaria mercenaria]XP_053404330.1 uncharacterized protein LOC123554183 [Mercenaria mercenaria]XP_053404331.1 uncharacterized protein LOC123554183 [Mercenaria mercenaria]